MFRRYNGLRQLLSFPLLREFRVLNKRPVTLNVPLTPQSTGKFQAFLETALVFVVFFIQGAWPVPDVNEPHYLTKMIHFWNPDWIGQDFFLNSADTHTVFYFSFGWLMLVLPPLVVAWMGRLLTWGLMAYTWRRLSLAVLPRRWWSILTAALFLCLLDRCHMAGEWVAGGIEAKGFAYAFVFLGLENLVRNRWNLVWLWFGVASLFHILVGGWAVASAGIAWLIVGRERPKLRTMWPGLLAGGLLSLPAIIPSIRLTWGVDAEIVSQANQIYVFQRLGHHLNPAVLPSWFITRFSLLALVWLFVWGTTLAVAASQKKVSGTISAEHPSGCCGKWFAIPFSDSHRLQSFVAGSVIIAIIGAVIGLLGKDDPAWSAGLLRFYWFRLADVAVPLGVALGGCSLISFALQERPKIGRRWLVLAIIVVGIHFGNLAIIRPVPGVPRADRLPHYECWRHACEWVADAENIPPGSRFLTPRVSQTFKWYAGHSEVVNWKDIPQDAGSIVEWWRRMNDIHGGREQGKDSGDNLPKQPEGCCVEMVSAPLYRPQWHRSLASQGKRRLQELGIKYDADYVITRARPELDLTVVYKNPAYIIYRLDRNGSGDK